MVIAGIDAAYPDADRPQILTPEGIELLDAVDEGCTGEVFAAANGAGAADLFVPGGDQSDEWAELGARQQDAATEKTNDAPTLIIHSNATTTVPDVLHRPGRAADVRQRPGRGPRRLPPGGHGGAAVPAYAAGDEAGSQERFDPDAGAARPTPAASRGRTASARARTVRKYVGGALDAGAQVDLGLPAEQLGGLGDVGLALGGIVDRAAARG